MRAPLRIASCTLLLASAGAALGQEPQPIGFRCLLREAEAFVLEDGGQVLVTGGDFALGLPEPVPHVVRVSRPSLFKPWKLDWVARLDHPVEWGFGALHSDGGTMFVNSSHGTTRLDLSSGEVVERFARLQCLDVRNRVDGGCIVLLSGGAAAQIWSGGERAEPVPLEGAAVAGKLSPDGLHAILAVSRRMDGNPALVEVDLVSLTVRGTERLGCVDDPLGADHFALDARFRGDGVEGALALVEGHRGRVACFEATSGDPDSFRTRWILDPDRDRELGFYSPVFANDVALLGAGDAPTTVVVPRFGNGAIGALLGFDHRTGDQQWRQARPFGDFVGLDVDALDGTTLLAVGGSLGMGDWDAHGHAQGFANGNDGPPRSSWSLGERALRQLLVDALR